MVGPLRGIGISILKRWVLASYPEKADEFEQLPGDVMFGLYHDFASFGPSITKAYEARDFLDQVFQKADFDTRFDAFAHKKLSKVWFYSEVDMTGSYVNMVDAVNFYSSALSRNQKDLIKDFNFSYGDGYHLEAKILIESLSIAWTILDLSLSEPHVEDKWLEAEAKKLLGEWEICKTKLNEFNSLNLELDTANG